jgi:subtilase family serine protease
MTQVTVAAEDPCCLRATDGAEIRNTPRMTNHARAACVLRQIATTITIMAVIIAAAHPAAAQAVAISRNHPTAAPASAMTARADAGAILKVRVSFALRNRNQLMQLLADQQNPASPQYHKWLSPAAFGSRFGRTTAEVAAVTDWLARQGFQIVDASSREITSRVAVADAESAFATTIGASSDGALYANRSDPQIPPQFAGIIASIDGLDNLRHSQPWAVHSAHPSRNPAGVTAAASKAGAGLSIRPKGTPASPQKGAVELASMTNYTDGLGNAFGPADLWTFYDETPLLSAGTNGGAGDCVAVIEDTDFLTAAVTLFDTNFGLSAANLTRILADGINPGRKGDEIEALLDIEWAHAVAPSAAVSVYIGNPASATIDPLVDALKRAVNDNTCGAISVSYGFCGASNSFYTGTLDPIFVQAAAQGQSVFISSGDYGAAGLVLNGSGTACVVGSSANVSEMAADSNIVSVGGTQFTPNFDGSGNNIGSVAESVWNDRTGASGGGKSAIFAKPSYQNSVTPADGSRDVPDIAVGASPISPGFYWGDDASGTPVMNCCVGGTSIAAPMWAGIAKLVEQSLGSRVGNLNPRIYQLGALGNAAESGLRDVTAGNNSFNHVTGFAAGTGYNQTTGWGSADIATFVAAYPANSPTRTSTPTTTPTTTPTPATQ